MMDRLVSDCVQILQVLLKEETNVNTVIRKTGLYKNRVFKAEEKLGEAKLIIVEKSPTHDQKKILRLTSLGREMAQFTDEVNRFDRSYFQLLELVKESFFLSEDTPKAILNRKLLASGWTRDKINSYPELSDRARSFGVPFFMFTLNAVIVRYATILTSFKVDKTATIILTRMVIDEVILRTESIPGILQSIGYSGSDPAGFTQRITDSFFKTIAMVFLELARQTIPQGRYGGLTDLFEIEPLRDYFRSLNILYRPSKESIDSIVDQMKRLKDKDEKLLGCIPFFEKLLQST
jgi:hypothetical protein